MVEIDRRGFIVGALATTAAPAFGVAPAAAADVVVYNDGCVALTVMNIGTIAKAKAFLLAHPDHVIDIKVTSYNGRPEIVLPRGWRKPPPYCPS